MMGPNTECTRKAPHKTGRARALGTNCPVRLGIVPSLANSPHQWPPPWPPVLATRGPGGESQLHAHHAMHVLLARAGTLQVRTDEGSSWQACAGIVSAPNALHAVDARNLDILLVFVDPESDVGRSLCSTIEGRLRHLTAGERDELVDAGTDPMHIMGEGGIPWTTRTLRVLRAAVGSPRQVHPGVRRLLRMLPNMPVRGAIPVEDLAGSVGLSTGRFMHVFEESIGIPLRPYLLWLKLQRAAGAVAAGESLMKAAHGAGFSDAAHMTRTFRRMLGVPPSALRRPIVPDRLTP